MKRNARALALLAVAAGAFTFSAPSAKAQDATLPDGEGKDLVQKVCTACHDVGTATSENHTAAEWKSVVDTMVSRGAEGTDEQFATIVKYLTANFGPKK